MVLPSQELHWDIFFGCFSQAEQSQQQRWGLAGTPAAPSEEGVSLELPEVPGEERGRQEQPGRVGQRRL